METFISITVGVLAAALVVFTIVYNIRKRKKGSGCCGDCSQCSCCSALKTQTKPSDKPSEK